MQVFEVNSESIKSVMNQLFKGTAFDRFLVRGAEISVFTKIEISGILDKNYLTEAERKAIDRNYVFWDEIKPFALSLIKGSRTPGILKIIFSITDGEVAVLHKSASAMFLNFLYEEGKLRFTTAVGLRGFSLDKSADAAWDTYIKRFLSENKWSVSTLS